MKRLTGNPFRMKQLTLAQARECETAQHPKCVCRCHGAYHGKNRVELNMETTEEGRKLDRAKFTLLALDDPHRLLPEDEEKAYAKARKEIRRRHLYHGSWYDAAGARTFTDSAAYAEKMGYTWKRKDGPIVELHTREYVGYGADAVIAEYDGPCPLCTGDGDDNANT